MNGLYTYCNPPFSSKYKSAKDFTKGNSLFLSSLVIFWAQTPALTQVLTFTFAFAFIISLSKRYINKYLQKAIKLALKSFIKGQKHSLFQANYIPCK